MMFRDIEQYIHWSFRWTSTRLCRPLRFVPSEFCSRREEVTLSYISWSTRWLIKIQLIDGYWSINWLLLIDWLIHIDRLTDHYWLIDWLVLTVWLFSIDWLLLIRSDGQSSTLGIRTHAGAVRLRVGHWWAGLAFALIIAASRNCCRKLCVPEDALYLICFSFRFLSGSDRCGQGQFTDTTGAHCWS